MISFNNLLRYHAIGLGSRLLPPLIPYGDNKDAGHYVVLNNARLYYEVYGMASLSCSFTVNGGNVAYMAPQIEYFRTQLQVITWIVRGRGKSELGNDSLYIHANDKRRCLPAGLLACGFCLLHWKK